jgi:hypothetical protein
MPFAVVSEVISTLALAALTGLPAIIEISFSSRVFNRDRFPVIVAIDGLLIGGKRREEGTRGSAGAWSG